MLNLAICDNEPAIIEELEEYLDKISDISFDYEVFFSAEELYSYKKKRLNEKVTSTVYCCR